MLKKTIIFQLLISALGTLISYYLGQGQPAAYSFGLGCAVVLVSIGTHFWAWHQIIIVQKLIALATLGLVFKYGAVGALLFMATNNWPINQIFFMCGLLTLLVSLGYLAYLNTVKQR